GVVTGEDHTKASQGRGYHVQRQVQDKLVTSDVTITVISRTGDDTHGGTQLRLLRGCQVSVDEVLEVVQVSRVRINVIHQAQVVRRQRNVTAAAIAQCRGFGITRVALVA